MNRGELKKIQKEGSRKRPGGEYSKRNNVREEECASIAGVERRKERGAVRRTGVVDGIEGG